MEKNDKKILTWKEAYTLNKKAFELIFRQYPQMILSRTIFVIWDALTPYVSIYLTAFILDALASGRERSVLIKLVLLALVSSALISLVSAFLLRWRDTQSAGIYFKVKQIFANKLLDMDFVSIDDTKTHEKLSTIDQNRNGGWGLDRIIWNCEGILSAILTMLGGIALTITLFTTRVPQNAGRLTVLNHPLLVLLLIFVMLAVTYISPALSNRAGGYYARFADSCNTGNRLYSFFGYIGFDQGCAPDMRIYRQDTICGIHVNDKTGIFGSKGFFAKNAKGPIGLYNAASAAVSVIFTGFVYVFVCLKAWAGAFGVGAATQYIGAITKMSGGVSSLISTAGDMRNNASFLKLVFDFLEIPNTMRRGQLSMEECGGRGFEIEFRNVSFQYPGSDKYALRNANIKIRDGERLAVVGPNGSGKTTFIKLLCRLYDPTEGVILLNGTDIREINYHEYIALFSVVFQDFKLFAFPLGENVGAKVDYDKNLAETCLRRAGFGERFDRLEDGTETYLYREFSKNGVDISGGEAQKIALARTLYKDAPFIVLDEPTAALDPVAESEIYSNFNHMVEDRTAIYISHRLSSCRFCSKIIVFHDGEIVQRGNHEQLVAEEKGMYYELWNAQAQYYN